MKRRRCNHNRNNAGAGICFGAIALGTLVFFAFFCSFKVIITVLALALIILGIMLLFIT